MGQDTVGAAANSLRLLGSQALRHHPARGPQTRRAASTTPGTPLNLDRVDYLAEHVDEVAAHVQAVAPDAPPMPRQLHRLYDWYVESTGDADEAERRYRDTQIERHRLEHAVELGDYEAVCKNPCPRCGCWGLEWNPAGSRAQCLNRDCRTPDGRSSSWTLARLASQRVQRTEIWRRNAT